MNSLPSISRPKDIEFEEQWNVIKEAFKQSNVNMEVILLLTQAVLQIMNTGGYGSITVSMLNNFVQEVKIVQTKRSAAYLIRGEQPPTFDPLLDKDKDLV